MNKSKLIGGVAGVLLLAIVCAIAWRASRPASEGSVNVAAKPAVAFAPAKKTTPVAPATERPAETPRPVTTEEKAARIAKIKRDYDDIRAKTSADYSAAGANFPGGLNAFLRQLALLEREKRADFAKVLTPRELENLEMSETSAGQMVDRLLGSTNATVEQRRTVFQLQRTFEDQFALTFDLTPRALAERETARQQTQEKIRAVLGDDLFGSWLFAEGEDYGLWVAFAARNKLSESVPLDLWQAKNEYTRRRLELAAQKLSPDQLKSAQALLAQETEARVLQIVGASVLQSARGNVLSWLPKR